jgi:hypothetical protein
MKIGEVVAVVDKVIIERIERVDALKNQAQQILIRCSNEEIEIWKDIDKEYIKDKNYHYNVNIERKELVVTGHKWKLPPIVKDTLDTLNT